MVLPLWKIVWHFFYKMQRVLTMQPSNCFLLYLCQKCENWHSHKNLYTNGYSTFICNGPKLKTTHMSFKRWRVKLIVVHHGILSSNKEEWIILTCNRFNKYLRYQAESLKSTLERSHTMSIFLQYVEITNF